MMIGFNLTLMASFAFYFLVFMKLKYENFKAIMSFNGVKLQFTTKLIFWFSHFIFLIRGGSLNCFSVPNKSKEKKLTKNLILWM